MTPREEHAARLAEVVARGAAPGFVPVHRWYLRHDRPWTIACPDPRPEVDLVRARDCTIAFYRFLYETVGHDWLWGEMRRASDGTIAARLAEPGNRVHYLAVQGTPAGFVEVQVGESSTELAYVGLMPGFGGRGLGRWMLATAIHATLAERRQPMTINTCTTDSPAGLALYRSLGFQVTHETDFEERDPRADGLIAADVHAAIPLAI